MINKQDLIDSLFEDLVEVWSWDCGCTVAEGRVLRRCTPQGPFVCYRENGKPLIGLFPKEMVDAS